MDIIRFYLSGTLVLLLSGGLVTFIPPAVAAVLRKVRAHWRINH